jgi:hypothetical protein
VDGAEATHLTGEPQLAAAVLARLRRIERLRVDGSAGAVLGELRALVPEAEAWARCGGDERACRAAASLRKEAEGMR